jgi:hypothetical protein
VLDVQPIEFLHALNVARPGSQATGYGSCRTLLVGRRTLLLAACKPSRDFESA